MAGDACDKRQPENMKNKSLVRTAMAVAIACGVLFHITANAQTNSVPETNTYSFTMPASWWTTNKITLDIDTNWSIYAGDQGTNWLTVSNSLRFGDSYVVCVTPQQWRQLTNTYPDKVEKMPIQFYRK